MLRRMEKRILVDLPNCPARRGILKKYLPHTVISKPKLTAELDYDLLAEVSVIKQVLAIHVVQNRIICFTPHLLFLERACMGLVRDAVSLNKDVLIKKGKMVIINVIICFLYAILLLFLTLFSLWSRSDLIRPDLII